MCDWRADLASKRGSIYERRRDLPRLVPLWPAEIDDMSAGGQLRLLAKLRKALRAERQRGVSGHWCYDLARHRHLLAAYRAEVAAAVKGCPAGGSHDAKVRERWTVRRHALRGQRAEKAIP